MSICQAIDIQLQKLQAQPDIDTQNIPVDQYDQLLDRLNRDIDLLSAMKNILNLEEILLPKLDRKIEEQNVNLEKLDLTKLVATSEEDITEGTIVFSGNLITSANSLPDSLKYIDGSFVSLGGKLERVKLEFVNGNVNINRCSALKEAYFGYVRGDLETGENLNLISFSIEHAGGYIYLKNCANLNQVKFGVLKSKLILTGCSSLKLAKILPIADSQSISAESDIYVADSGLSESTDFEIKKVFNISNELAQIYKG